MGNAILEIKDHAEGIGIVGGVVNLSYGDPVINDEKATFFEVGNDMRCVK